MNLYEVESKIKDLEASCNKEADNLIQELNAYKKKNPILPLYGNDLNVDKMIADKNRIIRSQYTRHENKIHKLWEKFYDDVTDIITAEYNLSTDVAKLVVQQVRDRDMGRSELTFYLDHYAVFAKKVLDTECPKEKTVFERTVSIRPSEAEKINSYLSGENMQSEDNTISVTVEYDDGMQMDIKCCGGGDDASDASWTEAVLFAPSCLGGGQVACTDADDTFVQTWEIEYENRIYRAIVDVSM